MLLWCVVFGSVFGFSLVLAVCSFWIMRSWVWVVVCCLVVVCEFPRVCSIFSLSPLGYLLSLSLSLYRFPHLSVLGFGFLGFVYWLFCFLSFELLVWGFEVRL